MAPVALKKILPFAALCSSAEAYRAVSSHAASENSTQAEAGGKRTCVIQENDNALGFGLSATFPVKHCLTGCVWNGFLTDTLPVKIFQDPAVDGHGNCKCLHKPKFWDKDAPSEVMFSFKTKSKMPCDKHGCFQIYMDWGNLYLKHLAYPGDYDRLPVAEMIEGQSNYDLSCTDGQPQGVVLPKPGNTAHELMIKIAMTTDVDEKQRLEDLLAKILDDKVMEIYTYDVDGDWTDEHLCIAGSDCEALVAENSEENAAFAELIADALSFQLKPCTSQKGHTVTELTEVIQNCGMPVEGLTLQITKTKMEWDASGSAPWGEEMLCKGPGYDYCVALQEQVTEQFGMQTGDLISLRLKPCVNKRTGAIVANLKEAVEACGMPTLEDKFLPEKVRMAKLFGTPPAEGEAASLTCA